MRFGLTVRQRRWLQATTFTSSIASMLLLWFGDVVPSWLFYGMVVTAFGSGVTSMFMRRVLRAETEVLSVAFDDRTMRVETTQTGNRTIILADVRDVNCYATMTTRYVRRPYAFRGPFIRVRYRDRANKVLFAEVDFDVTAPWMPELVDHLLTRDNMQWRIDGTEADPAAVRAWLAAARSPAAGRDVLDAAGMASDSLRSI
ncbi:MAG: hypothetical protein FGM24_06430 [Candidatus Kapabacteria bacterium]|nr:hypothetical protein [Candidatus Kapabacteria bacterium]